MQPSSAVELTRRTLLVIMDEIAYTKCQGCELLRGCSSAGTASTYAHRIVGDCLSSCACFCENIAARELSLLSTPYLVALAGLLKKLVHTYNVRTAEELYAAYWKAARHKHDNAIACRELKVT
jgi:hypothetical protein